MKNLFLFIALFFTTGMLAMSQSDRVEWTGKAEKISDNTYKVVLTASVDEGWYIYSQFMQEGGPVPTEIAFEGNNFKVDGKVKEDGEITKEMFDDVFEIDIKKFGKKATFTQIVKTNGKKPMINALVTFMSCNDDRCNPPRRVKVPVVL